MGGGLCMYLGTLILLCMYVRIGDGRGRGGDRWMQIVSVVLPPFMIMEFGRVNHALSSRASRDSRCMLSLASANGKRKNGFPGSR